MVGGDFSFYQFPTPDYWRRLFDESPGSLRFGFKVPEEITVRTWPGHARYGSRAGQVNASFLDAHHFDRGFVRALEPYRDRVATLMFEFGTFSKTTFTAAEFTQAAGRVSRGSAGGFRYAVEIRNSEYLKPDYFATLADHNVAHVFNAWTRMPDLGDASPAPRRIHRGFHRGPRALAPRSYL